MRVGMIGYGNLGGAVVRGLLSHSVLRPSEIMIGTRNRERLRALIEMYPGIAVGSNAEVAKGSDVLIICVRTDEVRGLLLEISPFIDAECHLVMTNGGLTLNNIETMFLGKVSRIVPAVTMEVGRGVTLVCHNGKVGGDDRARLEGMFSKVSMVKVMREDDFEIGADLTSCAPAFVAEMAQKFAEAAVRHGDITIGEAKQMVMEMLIGTSIMLADRDIGVEELKARVATKGGITEKGLMVLDREIPRIFDEVMERTMAQHDAVKRRMDDEFRS